MGSGEAAGWWGLALTEEVTATAPLSVSCGSRQFALFRDSGGQARALKDRCAHRRARLSLGRMRPEGWVECPYHGWSYDGATGACMAIPNLNADEHVPARYGVEPFAVRERDGLVYVWAGPMAEADPSQPVPLTIPSSERSWSGSRLLAFPHGDLVELLLDAPGLALDITGVTIVDDRPLGDPVLSDGLIRREFAADWTRLARRRTRQPADYPLALRVTLEADLGGLALVEVMTDSFRSLATALIAAAPARPAVTALRWRGAGAADSDTIIKPRDRIEPEGLMKILSLGGPLWRGLPRGSQTPLSTAA
jgi:nitrite reductase/ring-hydroxylating ferredoxin subunit